jgi:hypothetical protein
VPWGITRWDICVYHCATRSTILKALNIDNDAGPGLSIADRQPASDLRQYHRADNEHADVLMTHTRRFLKTFHRTVTPAREPMRDAIPLPTTTKILSANQ